MWGGCQGGYSLAIRRLRRGYSEVTGLLVALCRPFGCWCYVVNDKGHMYNTYPGYISTCRVANKNHSRKLQTELPSINGEEELIGRKLQSGPVVPINRYW